MIKHYKYTHIKQFREIISDINKTYKDKEPPTLKFTGTIKLHGTNASVCYDGSNLWCQSRKNVISMEQDNAGFSFFVESHKDWFKEQLKALYKDNHVVSLYGEWCGGSIQKGVAINKLPKKFVLFAVKYTNINNETDHVYIKPTIASPENDIYNIYDFKTWNIDIDFKNPAHAQNKIVDWVLEVENECPFAKNFGVSGVGEGIVFSHFNDNGERVCIFKAKGEKHSSSKVKKIVSINPEKMDSINEFVDYSVTENRLNQAIEQVFTINSEVPIINKMGDFIRWIISDITREEMDTLVANKLEPKDVNKYISVKARVWFIKYLDDMALKQ